MSDKTRTSLTYADAGVDIALGDDVSQIFYNAARQTWENRKGKLGEVIAPFDDFSGVRAIDVSSLPAGTLMNMGLDGVGTKIEVAEGLNQHHTIANDLIAMICDDAVVRGAEPVLVGSILDVNSLKDENKKPYLNQARQLAYGYVCAAKLANVAIINGETAELGNRVNGIGGFNYNWGGAVVWFANRARLLTGKKIIPGDSLVGLQEQGFRSNGLSLVRRLMEEFHGNDWYKQYNVGIFGNQRLGEVVLRPSKIYTMAVVDMFGGYDLERRPRAEIHGVAHITGGGLPGKLGRMLKPSGLGAVIDNPFDTPRIMMYIRGFTNGRLSEEECYRTWNMGQGMVIATPEPEKVMEVAEEHEIKSQRIGYVKGERCIEIKNRASYLLKPENPVLYFA